MDVRPIALSEILRLVAAAAAVACLVLAAAISGLSDRAYIDSAAEASDATPYEIDITHSTVNYRIRHLGVSPFFGRINMPEGSFLLDAANLEASHVHIVVQIANMDAGNEGRNKFLTGIDFFNAVEFPTAEFKSTSLKPIDERTWEATGSFTLHGVTKTITVRLEDCAAVKTSRFGHRAGFFVAFTIKRSEYGMSNFMDEDMLGDEVMIFAGIEGAHE